jgi:hypothetical protein
MVNLNRNHPCSLLKKGTGQHSPPGTDLKNRSARNIKDPGNPLNRPAVCQEMLVPVCTHREVKR